MNMTASMGFFKQLLQILHESQVVFSGLFLNIVKEAEVPFQLSMKRGEIQQVDESL
jgi:hypothetical protein